MESTKFRHVDTGEVVTQVPMMQIANYEKLEDFNKRIANCDHMCGSSCSDDGCDAHGCECGGEWCEAQNV